MYEYGTSQLRKVTQTMSGIVELCNQFRASVKDETQLKCIDELIEWVLTVVRTGCCNSKDEVNDRFDRYYEVYGGSTPSNKVEAWLLSILGWRQRRALSGTPGCDGPRRYPNHSIDIDCGSSGCDP